jgi:hypothetical protein
VEPVEGTIPLPHKKRKGAAVLRRREKFLRLLIMEVQQNTTIPSGYEGLTFEKVWAMFQETDKKFRETDRQIRQNQKMMSDLGRKFGKIIEHMFIPNLKEKFNALDYEFGKASSNVFIENREHQIYTEIDVFLENGDCALAVEIKTQANINDIREHVERMEKLRRYFNLHNDTRKLFGAVAAAVIPDNVRDYALGQGFYVIKQSGDNVSIEEPRGRPKAW